MTSVRVLLFIVGWNYHDSPYITRLIANSMIWRPSWASSCIYSKQCLNSETKAFIEFLGPQNPVVGSIITVISHILRELKPIQWIGSHLGRHLGFFKFLNSTSLAPGGFLIRTPQRVKIHWEQNCTKFCRTRHKIFIIPPDYFIIKTFKTRDYFDATASNWNTSAQSRPLASLFV